MTGDSQTITQAYYKPLLAKNGFELKAEDALGTLWAIDPAIGSGTYWIYGQKNLYDIKIHDFTFHEDRVVEVATPPCLSVTYYESISGEERFPYRRLRPNCVKSFIGGNRPFKATMHGKVPIQSVGIEILPAYYESYLKAHYPDVYANPYEAFETIDETDDFPEMVHLLMQIKHYNGDGIAAKLFYDAKVAEAVALIVARQQNRDAAVRAPLSEVDKRLLQSVTAYIDAHYAECLRLEHLSQIACMGATKLKRSFKLLHGCTVTAYIQSRRMAQAAHLLSATELSIAQVAHAVGYKSASRFAELFRKATGLLPTAYRRFARGDGSFVP